MKATVWWPDAAATRRWGRALGRRLAAGDVVALVGPLGAGKTTLALAVLVGLGAQRPRGSPSFTLVKPYRVAVGTAYHVDLYRLEDPAAVADLDWDEVTGPGGVALVEWADRFPALLPPAALWVAIEVAGKGRLARLSGPATWADRLAGLAPMPVSGDAPC